MLRLYRIPNLVLVGMAQFFAAFFLVTGAKLSELLDSGIHYLIFGSLACMAFGNLMNDYLDSERDRTNGRQNVAEKYARIVPYNLAVFALLALAMGYLVSWHVMTLLCVVLVALSVYNLYLKNYFILGNVLIALLSGFSIFIVRFLFPDIEILLLLHFSVLAALISFIREVVKDVEDVKGDQEAGAKTLPILFGVGTSGFVVQLTSLFALAFILISIYYQKAYFPTALYIVYGLYNLLFVVLPIFAIAVWSTMSNHPAEFTKMSHWLKYVLATGILSMLFF